MKFRGGGVCVIVFMGIDAPWTLLASKWYCQSVNTIYMSQMTDRLTSTDSRAATHTDTSATRYFHNLHCWSNAQLHTLVPYHTMYRPTLALLMYSNRFISNHWCLSLYRWRQCAVDDFGGVFSTISYWHDTVVCLSVCLWRLLCRGGSRNLREAGPSPLPSSSLLFLSLSFPSSLLHFPSPLLPFPFPSSLPLRRRSP